MTTNQSQDARGRDSLEELRATVGVGEHPVWDALREHDPDLLDSMAGFAAVTTSSTALSPVERSLVLVAVAAAVTANDMGQVRAQAVNAFANGATLAEVEEALHVVSVLGSHALIITLPILRAAMDDEAGFEQPLTPEQHRLKAEWQREWGFWSEIWETMLRLDPAFFAAYLRFSRAVWRRGVLSPRLIELIYVGIDASTTHLYARGADLHIRRALEVGATPQELAEVLRLVGGQGLRSLLEGLPTVYEAYAGSRDGDTSRSPA
jgi:alkylhydroperoxidase/carboxymuconolactone decarboxylase family protein YurZ